MSCKRKGALSPAYVRLRWKTEMEHERERKTVLTSAQPHTASLTVKRKASEMAEEPAVSLSGGERIHSRVVERLRECWRTESLCDVVLRVEGRSFKTHCIILMSASDCFAAHFEKDSDSSLIELPTLSAAGFEPLMIFCYEGEVTLDGAAVFEVMRAANSSKVLPLCDAAMSSIIERLCRLGPETCLKAWY